MIQCPICDASRSYKICNLRGSRTGLMNPLYFCLRCNYYYQRPNYQENNDTLRGDLRWHIEQIDEGTRRTRNYLNRISKYHPNAETFLDIGCGIGTTLRVGSEFGLEVQGVEPNHYAVEYAKNKMSLDLTEGFFNANMFSMKFDIVFLYMVLEHVSDPKSLIHECLKVLNRDGILLLAVPKRTGGTLRILYSLLNQRGSKSLFSDNDAHINHFSRKSIERLLMPYHCTILCTLRPGTYIIRYAGE